MRCNRYSLSLRLDIGRNHRCQRHEGCWGVCKAHAVFSYVVCSRRGSATRLGCRVGLLPRIPYRHITKKPAQGLPICKLLSLRVQVCVTIENGHAEAFELRANGLGYEGRWQGDGDNHIDRADNRLGITCPYNEHSPKLSKLRPVTAHIA